MKAFTDYFGEVEEILMLSYDGNKYVDILRPNGEKTSIKRGYCFKNPSKWTKDESEKYGSWKPKPQLFSKYVWWKLEGKRKEDFAARKKDWYSNYYCEDKKFKTRREAIRFAIKSAKTSDKDMVEVGKQNEVYYFECHSDGDVVIYDRSKRSLRHKGFTKPKWIRGRGKIKYRGKRHGRKCK